MTEEKFNWGVDWRLDRVPLDAVTSSRGRRITAVVHQELFYEGVEMCLLQLDETEWWITPNDPDDDHLVKDIGPFADLEDAKIHFRLICETPKS